MSWKKGCYVGQEVISRLDSYDKVARYLMGFETAESTAVAPGDRLRRKGTGLGRVTSVAPRPGGGMVGLAIVNREAAGPGVAELETSDGTASVDLMDRPFWQ